MRKFYFILFLFLSSGALGQIRELNFNRLSVENGLPENFATCFLQDKLGYMWFGTQNGMVRYDGYNLKVYNLETADKKERTFRTVWSIYEDKIGTLWVGTFKHGLFRFNRSQDNFTYFPHASQKDKSEINHDILKIVEDKEVISGLTILPE